MSIMAGTVWLFSLLVCQCAASSHPSLDDESLKPCPYPPPENIEPCSCQFNEKFQIFLICDIRQDMDRKLLQKLSHEFTARNEVHLFYVNLNGNKWITDFSPDLLGQFKISYFHLSNVRSIEGDIQGGAFNGSTFSLKELIIENKGHEYDYWDGSKKKIRTGAFSKLQNINKISLGSNFESIKPEAFSDLPNLQELNLESMNLRTIYSDSFENLPMLKTLDLSNKGILSLLSRAFSNLSSLIELNLSSNGLLNIKPDTFSNLPSLINLDLSSNRITKIGSMFSFLQNL